MKMKVVVLIQWWLEGDLLLRMTLTLIQGWMNSQEGQALNRAILKSEWPFYQRAQWLVDLISKSLKEIIWHRIKVLQDPLITRTPNHSLTLVLRTSTKWSRIASRWNVLAVWSSSQLISSKTIWTLIKVNVWFKVEGSKQAEARIYLASYKSLMKDWLIRVIRFPRAWLSMVWMLNANLNNLLSCISPNKIISLLQMRML